MQEACARAHPSHPLLCGIGHAGDGRGWWYRSRNKAGLGGWAWVDLRTVASICLRALVGPDEAARMMGHSPEVAMRQYHVENPEIRGRLFGRPVPSD